MQGDGADGDGEWEEGGRRAPGATRSGRPGRVLVVEDPVETAGALAASLVQAGWAVRACVDGVAALHAFIRELPDLIVASAGLAGVDAFALLRGVREISDVPVIVVESERAPVPRGRSLGLGAGRFGAREIEVGELPAVALALARAPQHPSDSPAPLTAAHVRRLARSQLQAELERLLVECRGNLAEMARRMGKDRSTVRYHLRRFGMLVEETASWSGGPARDAPHDGSAPIRG